MNTKTFVEMTDKWYEYVSMDHHKDRDCHWVIETDFAYGNKPTYIAMHHGYIANSRTGQDRETYQEAFEDLVEFLKDAIDGERDWAKEVLLNPEEYDGWDITRASFFKNEFGL